MIVPERMKLYVCGVGTMYSITYGECETGRAIVRLELEVMEVRYGTCGVSNAGGILTL